MIMTLAIAAVDLVVHLFMFAKHRRLGARVAGVDRALLEITGRLRAQARRDAERDGTGLGRPDPEHQQLGRPERDGTGLGRPDTRGLSRSVSVR